MPTKITRADGKNVTLGCAVCHETVTVSEEQQDEDTTGLFIICEDCSELSPEELARKRLEQA